MPRNPVPRTTPGVRTVAFLGDYLPRKCGIATFTSDLLRAVAARNPLSRCFVVPVNDIEGGYQYPDAVRFQIEEQDLGSYRRAAGFLNTSNVDVVSLQHEFGIFGGPAGSHLLTLLDELRAPVVTTLHTILLDPNAGQRQVMQELIAHSTRLVVMTERGRAILQEVYRAPQAKIDLIPHGIPDMPFIAPDFYKGQFGLSGRKVLLTFGLLSPNKGIEHVLHALPEVVAEFPDLVYIVLGATHPHELRTHGESYRLGLEAIARNNKIQRNVIFHNRFVELKELTEFIGAADLYITPYLDEAQITSGTLAYAFGAGKAVVSTPYWHAEELLRDQRGVLVPFADPSAIALEVNGLLRDATRRIAMGAHAYQLGRAMAWSNTALLYTAAFEAAAAPREFVAANGFGHHPHESPELNREPALPYERSNGRLYCGKIHAVHSRQENTMTFSTRSLEATTGHEDVLACLPVSKPTAYGKGQIIYGPDNVSKSFYLVVAGKVGISQISNSGSEVLLEIVRADEVFGESAFLDVSRPLERAKAIEKTELMTWAISDIEELVTKRPRLAVALMQILAQRNADYTRRIESFAHDTIGRRLARSLLRLSERLGTPEEDGSVRMMPITHGLLSSYVGTSREIITQYMNRFRKKGYVNYSRQGIILYRDTLCQELQESGFHSRDGNGLNPYALVSDRRAVD